MPLRPIAGALILLAATAGLQLAGAAEQAPAPRAETAVGALAPAGVARSWGEDSGGQLGNGVPLADEDSPVAVGGLTNVVQLAGGDDFSLALLSDGTVMSWGDDDLGQLGNGATTGDQPSPGAVSGLSAVKAVAAGGNHALALLSNGTVRAWGFDVSGQLGDGGANADQTSPVAVSGLSGVKAIAAGRQHSLALRSNGTVRSWGSDFNGRLGDGGANTNQPAPVAVSGLSGVAAIAGGEAHSLALLSGGTVMSWGGDSSGQLGNGATTGDQASPVDVEDLSGVLAVVAGGFHSLALLSDGTVMSWGSDGSGQLGNGATTGNQASPVAVEDLSGVAAIASGAIHSLALLSDGTVMSWGLDGSGQLGNGATTGNQASP
ncbi:MAG: RCC1 repeat-containing protein, partial [Dehalococcoidia bacterium]